MGDDQRTDGDIRGEVLTQIAWARADLARIEQSSVARRTECGQRMDRTEQCIQALKLRVSEIEKTLAGDTAVHSLALRVGVAAWKLLMLAAGGALILNGATSESVKSLLGLFLK